MPCQKACDCTVGGTGIGPLISKLKSLDISPKIALQRVYMGPLPFAPPDNDSVQQQTHCAKDHFKFN